MASLGAKLGDLATVINATTNLLAGAIFADVGPRNKIGEGSIALSWLLGIPSDARSGGTDAGVFFIVFPGSGNGKPMTRSQIKVNAARLFKTFGG
jgi:hypothetical protein